MNQDPNNFNHNEFLNYSPSNPDLGNNLSPEQTEAVKKKARRWFLILLIVGLSLGGLLSIGVVKILNELGLTDRPERPILKIEN